LSTEGSWFSPPIRLIATRGGGASRTFFSG
jgi:hypothetical protein